MLTGVYCGIHFVARVWLAYAGVSYGLRPSTKILKG